jgi:hypothetical protein
MNLVQANTQSGGARGLNKFLVRRFYLLGRSRIAVQLVAEVKPVLYTRMLRFTLTPSGRSKIQINSLFICQK